MPCPSSVATLAQVTLESTLRPDRSTQAVAATRFLDLHRPGTPLLLPNPWDHGAAKLFASLGFEALATTSSGFAASRGHLDGQMSREESLAHAAELAAAVDIPVSADLENGFADDPEGVAQTIELAIEAGLAGASIEDWSRAGEKYPVELATERIAAAAEVAHAGPVHLVLTARADDGFHGVNDLGDTVTRLQGFQEAGADVLYAPALADLDAVRTVVSEVDRPVNVLAFAGMPSVAELAAAGVARISIGGAFAYAAYGAAADAATELLERGTFGFRENAGAGRAALRRALDA